MPQMKERHVITVDGLAGSGKSTIAESLAKRLGYQHFSSGLIYRVLGLLALQRDCDPANAPQILELLSSVRMELLPEGGVTVDGINPGPDMRLPEVSQSTSRVAALPEVRAALMTMQRQVFPEKNLVAEGRDMGTVVFPHADVKFFIVADTDIRVKRRLTQLGYDLSDQTLDLKSLKKEMEREIVERDQRDSQRAIAPTRAADDAIIVDNSAQTLTEVVESMYHAVAKRGLADAKVE